MEARDNSHETGAITQVREDEVPWLAWPSSLSEPLLTSQPLHQPLPSVAGLPLMDVQVVPCTNPPGQEGMWAGTCSLSLAATYELLVRSCMYQEGRASFAPLHREDRWASDGPTHVNLPSGHFKLPLVS